jgi:hypothetical protein
MRWCEQQRQDWIAETLRVFGFINRDHLIRKFGCSVPQASLDLAAFQRAHPAAMTYSLSAKRYEASPAVDASDPHAARSGKLTTREKKS